jgi:aminoglycoside phosphotransferase (APT) family kinase protein
VNRINELRDVIRDLHGTEATHVETVPVKETFQGQTVWEGDVEVFDLADHPKASRVFAWSHETNDPENPRQHITVLQIHQLQRH